MINQPDGEGEAFNVEEAYQACITHAEIEAACQAKDSLAFKYLMHTRDEAVQAVRHLVHVDPTQVEVITKLQATAKTYEHFADWIKDCLRRGEEAAEMLTEHMPEHDLAPEFADRDQPEEADNGSDDD